jgi:hypothetical protein
MFILEDFEKNINKRCKVTESTIAGLIGKEGIIKSVSGNQKVGFRYKIDLDTPIYPFLNISDCYPSVYSVEIL